MSRLYFTPVDKAFTLGSSQIKDTQEEIAQLTKLILDANVSKTKKPQKPQAPETPLQTPFNYSRIGPPDQQSAIFRPNTAQDDIDYNLMKVVGHPKFDDIVKTYALIHHPEWLLKETVYTPGYNSGNDNVNQLNYSKSTFGNKYQTTICSEIQRYILFFVTSIVVFIILSVML
jgi:hypothetical protein